MAFNKNLTSKELHKIVILGEQAVGKTSILTQFAYDTYSMSYQATIGIDFICKTIIHEDRALKLQLWDTAGQERFHCITPSYIRNSSVAIVVYDITCTQSLTRAAEWVNQVRDVHGDNALIILVGNKDDKELRRQVSFEEGQKVALKLQVMFMEVSARTGHNIKNLFRRIASVLPQTKEEEVRLPGKENMDVNQIVLNTAATETNPSLSFCSC